jgi:trehalose 6-phosphate synthase
LLLDDIIPRGDRRVTRPSRTFPSSSSRKADPGQLIVVSNRVMFPESTSAGGLAQALSHCLRARGGTWMGWSGKLSTRVRPQRQEADGIRYVTWDMERRDFNAYYRDYANRTLWPLLHSRTDLLAFRRSALQGYLRVNERFADFVARVAGPRDTIWVHDYHLIPLGSLLRARGVQCRIGFFLHTPVPAPRTLAALPQHRAMLGLLAAYDLVGVQTQADANSLRSYLIAEAGAVENDGLLDMPGADTLQVRAFPVGIDPTAMARLAEAAQQGQESRELRQSLGDSALMIGVDRLDYSKGLPQRLRAFGQLLDRSPELHGHATFLQVTPESRRDVTEYRRLSREVQRVVGDINGHHATTTWTPVRYLNRSYPHSVLAGFYRLARVCAVTPLRDGMNLVAKEYLACQSEADPGVLVLSEFAGAAQELGASAIIVNPFDVESCSRAMMQAFAMPLPERQQRWRDAMRVLERGNVHRWCDDFLTTLTERSTLAAPVAGPGREAATAAGSAANDFPPSPLGRDDRNVA